MATEGLGQDQIPSLQTAIPTKGRVRALTRQTQRVAGILQMSLPTTSLLWPPSPHRLIGGRIPCREPP